MKALYRVDLTGCDDETTMELELTDEQARQLRALAALSKRRSEYGCQPVLFIKRAT